MADELVEEYMTDVIYPLLGDQTTFLSQLDKVGRQLFGIKFKGVFSSDKIPKLSDLSPYCILNLDKSNEPGSHWVALVKLTNKNGALIYDSFGRDYKKIIPDVLLSGNGRIINTDDDCEQQIEETNCGQRCLAFIIVFDLHGERIAKQI